MGLFKSADERRETFLKAVDEQGGRFCKYFGTLNKDLSGADSQINIFLKEYPQYRLVAMTSSIGPLGAGVLCYFEKI